VNDLDDVLAVLRLRHALTGQRWNGDDEARDWLDVLRPFSLDAVKAALTMLARLDSRVHLRALLERLDPEGVPRPETARPLGAPSCYECNGTGFSQDSLDPSRLAPCSLCQSDRRRAVEDRGRAFLRAEEERLRAVERDLVEPTYGRLVAERARAREAAYRAALRPTRDEEADDVPRDAGT
jgi:hypothetical protein